MLLFKSSHFTIKIKEDGNLVKKKRVLLLLGGTLALFLSLAGTVYASNDSISFKFTVSPWQQNGKAAGGRYRQTTHPENPWKVKLNSSSEGSGTITRFWLEDASANNVSTSVDATQGLGPYYTNALTTASQKTVWLTGENNNYNGVTYSVAGVWDEETWN
ncbi:hypothetical protein FC62_GL001241 [Amylolactobacillus amylotrophicus DSM 20534]|uniref:Uncharacterized protein n=2 Tax=Amylolactobacillus TaxID=2767876 RepID=A0A0R1YMZ8_9LACO|nr:hypothetical protein FC62_GL001241 [Amylolactobacillus amylotrophicus DSM 20534]KRM43601.1 hypothetical protein FD40_GL001545 [Amylolactobacillus amylophilus DSM 20533 = JCM 1125]